MRSDTRHFSHGTIVLMPNNSKLGKKQIPLVIGNWKMNPSTLEKAERLLLDIKKALHKKNTTAQVGIASPFPFISAIRKLSAKTRISIAAQDVSYEESGAHTGEVSVAMLKSLDVKYVIVGHSERRAAGETDEIITKKVTYVLKNGLVAVVCIGERMRDSQGDYFSFVESQLKSVIAKLPKAQMNRLVVAYEPVWAIGTGKNATSEDVQEMKLFIQKVISDTLDRSIVSKVRIIYGGSVNKDNAKEILEVGHADGFLVGGASLKALDFTEIVKIADAYGKV